jgi:hypothetical protein
MRKPIPNINILTAINEKHIKITPKLRVTYKSLRKKGLFLMYSEDLEIAWNQMTCDERLLLYKAAMKRKKRRKGGKESRRKANRKFSFSASKGGRSGMFSSEIEADPPEIELERNIIIEKPLVIIDINRRRHFIPQIDLKPVRINRNRIPGLLK